MIMMMNDGDDDSDGRYIIIITIIESRYLIIYSFYRSRLCFQHTVHRTPLPRVGRAIGMLCAVCGVPLAA